MLKRLPFNEPSFFMPYGAPPQQISVDGRVLGFTLLLALLTSVVCGLLPALQASKPNLNAPLKERGGKSARGLVAQRSLLVVAEVALALLLLTEAGLMVKSFLRLQQVNPGFDPENVLTFDIRLPARNMPRSIRLPIFTRGCGSISSNGLPSSALAG